MDRRDPPSLGRVLRILVIVRLASLLFFCNSANAATNCLRRSATLIRTAASAPRVEATSSATGSCSGHCAAQAAAYAAVDAIDFPTGFCRRDIGWREVAREQA